MTRDLQRAFSRARDISIPVQPGMPVYPGDRETETGMTMKPGPGQPVAVSHWSVSAHAGTHLDAPSHFIPGAKRIDQFLPSELAFRALVCTKPDAARHVDEGLLQANAESISKCDAVLFRTRTGREWTTLPFDPGHAAIRADAARLLARMDHLRLVGIDYLSVEPFDADPFETHLELLGAGKLILETIDLSEVEDGFHGLVCLPIRLRDAEAAPARAVLLPDWGEFGGRA